MEGFIDLLQHYSLASIILIFVVGFTALKAIVDSFLWVREKTIALYNRSKKHQELKEEVDRKFQDVETRIEQLESSDNEANQKINSLCDKIDLLIQSDRDDIKAFITREHHYFCYQIGWIDDYSLACLEKRYEHYKAEGGNSFIETFMNELRALPKKDAHERREYYSNSTASPVTDPSDN